MNERKSETSQKEILQQERFDKIERKLERIEIKLDALLEKMEISVKECNKMGEHIDFIENELLKFCKSNKYIDDSVGMGPSKIHWKMKKYLLETKKS